MKKNLDSFVFVVQAQATERLNRASGKNAPAMKLEEEAESHGLSVSEQAADWLLRLQEAPPDPLLLQQFEAWMDCSAENREAWGRIRKAWRILGEVPPAYEDLWRGLAHERRASPWKRIGVGLAAATVGIAACFAIIAGPTMLIRLEADHYTGTAQNQSLTLTDGSVVILSADSAIKLNFDNDRREVALLKGEAFFDVQKDASRPFVVDAGELSVTVLGTQFDIRRGGQATDVSLLEGSVQASMQGGGQQSERILAPGEILTLNNDTGTMNIGPIAIEDIAVWRDGRLYVVDAEVGAVIEQMQRYHSAWLTIPDSGLASERVTGFYDLNDPDRALRALVEPFGGKVREISPLARLITRL